MKAFTLRGDTIAAIATPLGAGGMGVVRVSGDEALKVVLKVFSPSNAEAIKDHTVTYGVLVDPVDGVEFEEVMVTYMAGPRSYTREDVVEIGCHGGVTAVRSTLSALISSGARLAEPGEFTFRAFTTGRIDLAQAEAVADMVSAPTDLSLKAARRQLKGALSSEVEDLRLSCLDILASLEAEIDFSEDDVPSVDRVMLQDRLIEVSSKLSNVLKEADRGAILRHGIRVVIVGSPNVGKSSILNCLLRTDRAIVTEIPGTTRDSLEEGVTIGGLPFVITDTAGIRDATDPVESEGVSRSGQILLQSDVALLVIDGARVLGKADSDAISLVKSSGKEYVVVVNKVDLDLVVNTKEIESICSKDKLVFVSAATGKGMDTLSEVLTDLVMKDQLNPGEYPLVMNERHRSVLSDARGSVQMSIEAVTDGLPADFVTIGLQAAVRSLGEISGHDATEDLLGTIFSNFCIGK